MLLGGFCYNDDKYVIYCIKRKDEEVNVFVSKLVRNSQGFVMDDNFFNGEKEALDGMVQKILNLTDKNVLESMGIVILDSVSLTGVNYFDSKKCYVGVVLKKMIKECLIYYKLVNKSLFEQPIIEVIDDTRVLNEGFALNIGLIIFGTGVLIFSIVVIFNFLFG